MKKKADIIWLGVASFASSKKKPVFAKIGKAKINRRNHVNSMKATLAEPTLQNIPVRPPPDSAAFKVSSDLAMFAGLRFLSVAFDLKEEKRSDPFQAVQERAETVTAVLEGILHHKIPLPSWI